MSFNSQNLMETYPRCDIAIERGEGVYLYDVHGRRYLDFASGIAVNSLGHCHPHIVEALKSQAEKLWHTSNLYQVPGQESLSTRLCENCFADRVFFTNSGAEALEGCIKTARKYFSANGNPEKYRIITFEGAFHGRTLATLAAGGQAKHMEGFGPMLEGFDQVAVGDLSLVENAISNETAAILIEPISGEGGVRAHSREFMQGLRKLCDKHGLLLILDEVQCGMGRSGYLFAHELSDITPDIMGVAKGIGGGFPFGAFMATENVAKVMQAGTHGSTYGGNPLAMAVGNAVLDVMLSDGFLDHVKELGGYFQQRLMSLSSLYPKVFQEVRGGGLMRGIKLIPDVRPFMEDLREEGLMSVAAGENVLRLLPPLIINRSHIDEAIDILERQAAKIS